MALAAIAFACLVGPAIDPSSPFRVHPDLMALAPSLAPHPTPAEALAGARALAREFGAAGAATLEADGAIRLALAASTPIDPAIAGYAEGGDLFLRARVAASSDEGRRMVLDLEPRRTFLPLGTDADGRDLLARTLAAGRISIAVGLAAAALATAIGAPLGAIAGLVGGAFDAAAMRVVDAFYALPLTLFAILLVAATDRGIAPLLLAIGLVEWPDVARLARARALAARGRDHVVAARALGASWPRIMLRHVLPDARAALFPQACAIAAKAMLLEGFLSWLGLGVREPRASLGAMIAQGAARLDGQPWIVAPPLVLMVGALAALGRIADAEAAGAERSRR